MMNVSLDRYMAGLEESAVRIPEVDWENLDEDLWAEYIDQCSWMLGNGQRDALELARRAGRTREIMERIAKVHHEFVTIAQSDTLSARFMQAVLEMHPEVTSTVSLVLESECQATKTTLPSCVPAAGHTSWEPTR